jgi:hypothetical protein
MVSYETKLLGITRHANGHRATGHFFVFLALFAHLSLTSLDLARIVESWAVCVRMAREISTGINWIKRKHSCAAKFFLVKMLARFYAFVTFPLL